MEDYDEFIEKELFGKGIDEKVEIINAIKIALHKNSR